MDEYFAQIEAAVEAKLYLLALAATLTIPDICAGLGHESGTTTGARYIEWFNDNLPGYFSADIGDSGGAVYGFRCSMVHQHYAFPQAGRARLFFLAPDAQLEIKGSLVVMGDGDGPPGCTVDVPWFCRSIVDAARTWLATKADDPVVQANLGNIVQIHPDGVAPYINGLPVYA